MPEYIDVGVMLAVGALLWRQLTAVDRRLTGQIAALASQVSSVDRRLAKLEGRITGWQDTRRAD